MIKDALAWSHRNPAVSTPLASGSADHSDPDTNSHSLATYLGIASEVRITGRSCASSSRNKLLAMLETSVARIMILRDTGPGNWIQAVLRDKLASAPLAQKSSDFEAGN